MEKNTWNLEKVKKFLNNFTEHPDDYYMEIVNKETGGKGCATITQNKKIAVFEGKDDGSEDKILSQKEFKSKYKIEGLTTGVSRTTIEEIEEDLCDLDSEYREALANSLVKLKYISDTPIKLEYGTQEQRRELEKVWKKPLKGKQIEAIMKSIMQEMKGDFQYGRFVGIASSYMRIANDLKKGEEIKKNIKSREAR